ncbi:hypothetical protein [Legionella sp. WA2022007384]
MAKEFVPFLLKDQIDDALKQNTQELLEKKIHQALDTSSKKIYAARYLDHLLLKFQKQKKECEIIWAEEDKEYQAALKSDDPLVKFRVGIHNSYVNAGNDLNRLMKQIDPTVGNIYTSPDELKKQRRTQIVNVLEDNLLRVRIGRNAIELTQSEEELIKPNMQRLYQEQVNNRKWYQNGIFVAVVSVVLLPFSPLFYYLWKKDRDQELIQPNPITPEDRVVIRAVRQQFKKAVNNDNSWNAKKEFITEKGPRTLSPEVPEFVTKYRKDQDAFFLKNRQHTFFWVGREDRDFVKNSIEQDLDARMTLGL